MRVAVGIFAERLRALIGYAERPAAACALSSFGASNRWDLMMCFAVE